jgi:hypothetical protein
VFTELLRRLSRRSKRVLYPLIPSSKHLGRILCAYFERGNLRTFQHPLRGHVTSPPEASNFVVQLSSFGQTAVELYDAYQLKITGCESKIEQQLEQFETKLDFEEVLEQSGALKARSAQVRLELQRRAYLASVCGVDLTGLPGLSTLAVEVIISETGLDMNCWKSEKHFCSWLKVCPDNRISGGKLLRSRPRKTKNRAAGMFRLAAQGAMQSKDCHWSVYPSHQSTTGRTNSH